MGITGRHLRQKLLVIFLILGVFSASIFYGSTKVQAASGINTQMNFQGRLLNAQGAVVPDGYYNIQFKIYQDGDGQSAGDTTGSPAGTLKWTETYLNANSQGLRVQNGYLSVQLGTITPFGSSVNWNSDTLWLSMNIAGTGTTCSTFATCNPDGEMTPMKRLSSTAYAMNAQYLGGLASTSFLQLATGTAQVDSTTNSSVFLNKTAGSGNLIQLQAGGADTFVVTNSGDLSFGANGNHVLSVATAAASTAGKSLTLKGGAAGTGASALVGGDLVLQGGRGGGTNGNGGNLLLDAGAKNGTGSDGMVEIGTAAASTVQIGATTLANTQTINIGNNNTAGSTTTVMIGSVVGASSTTIQAGSGNITLTGVVSASSTINATGYKVGGTAGAAITCASGEYLQQQIVAGGITTGGTCTALVSSGGASSTLQDVYNNSNTTPYITLNSTGKGIAFRDASTPVGGNLFAIQDNAAATNFFAVTSSGASVAGTFNVTGTSTASVALNAPSLDVASAGTLNIGTTNATAIQIGGNNTNVTIGAGASATAGTTTIQAKGTVAIATNGITRATFSDTANTLYLGNGVSASTPNNYTITGTSSTASGTSGAALTVQGGSSTTGNTNGGYLYLNGGTAAGTGANGLVVVSTPTFSAITNDPNCFPTINGANADCTIAKSSVDSYGTILVGFTQSGKTATLPDPTITSAVGRVVYITAASNSKDFTLSVNGGTAGNLVAMRASSSATMIWNGNDWTAAGASSSTTLQAAYDNTLQGAGGAELVVSHTANTNGLTIRDSLANPVNGPLLTVQSSSASTVISINSNVTEYSSDSGAETPGSVSTPTTFPAGTWSALTGSTTVSRYTTVGDYIATGQASVAVTTSTNPGDGVKNTLTSALNPNMHYNVSFAARQSSNTVPFTDLNVYYSIDGTNATLKCIDQQIVNYSIWTKVNCAFTAPASGILSSNAIFIRQTSGVTHNFYIDNMSVTISADYNYATDPGVDDATNFSTNWTAVNSTVTRSTTYGNDTSDSAQAVTTGSSAGAGQGVRNLLNIKPLANTLYRVSVYVAASSAGFNDFTVNYSWNGNAANPTLIPCADYNTQAAADLSVAGAKFTQITCYIKTDGNTVQTPYMYFTQPTADATARTFYVDTFSMTLASETTPNVQIGGGSNGGPVALLTLDRAASAPIASNNDAFLGSMYYDTSLGKLQCYEADGWGACGSSPDVVVTISPEYTNAVMHGTGVGTMTSDICSSTLHINDGTSGQPTICASNETYNFYKWTSPQASPQTYSIYVSYQLPDTFKQFASGQTSLSGRTDSTNSSVQYSVYRNNLSTGLSQCGPVVPVSNTAVTSWQKKPASGAADPSTCGFSAGDSIVFKIDLTAQQNASAYVGNLNFTFSNR